MCQRQTDLPRSKVLYISVVIFRLVTCLTLAALLAAGTAWAGGSGLNVIVVVNQNSADSVQLGNDYCEQRGVPPQNLLRMTGWTGGSINWSPADFQTYLLNPLLDMIASRGLTQAGAVCGAVHGHSLPGDGWRQREQHHFGAVLRVQNQRCAGERFRLLLAAGRLLQQLCLLRTAIQPGKAEHGRHQFVSGHDAHGYQPCRSRKHPKPQRGGGQLVSHAKRFISPKPSDSARNVRFVEFDNAVFENQVVGNYDVSRIDTDATTFTNLFGLMTGLADLSLATNAFVPGALGDSLTSYGGDILENSGQTPLLAFLEAGAAGSYGTVVEPCNYTQKFPDPVDYFYQARGFSLAEAYYQSVLNPFQGLLVGEPLAAPFARPGERRLEFADQWHRVKRTNHFEF